MSAKLRPEDLTSEERAFNKLTPTQTELLALLSEECGEVVQVIGKILRHGLESFHPNGGPTNRELLAEEIGDCLCASRLLASAGMLNMASVEDRSAAKMEKVFRYLHHARRALFAPAPEKVANVETMADRIAADLKAGTFRGEQPAPPELSKVCPNCQKPEEEPHFAGNLTGDGGWYFCPGRVPKAVEDHQRPQSAQPVAVGMTEALRMILDVAESRAEDQRHDGLLECSRNLERAIAAVRQQAGNGRKVECPNCGKGVAYEHLHRDSWMDRAGYVQARYVCKRPQPAPPEPAAREMPEAVRDAVDTLRSGVPSYPTWRQYADALESWWRNLAQPVECKDCLKLIDERDRREEQIGRAAAALGMEDEWTSACDVGDALIERCEEISAAANSVLIQQAAQGRKVELGKVRELVNDLKRALSEAAPSEMTMLDPHEWRSDLDAALAELDDAEGKRRE